MKKIKNIVQSLLAIKFVRSTIKNLNLFIFGIASSNRIFSTIFYIFYFLPFNREQHAFIKGRYHYYKNLDKQRSTSVELRRNVHQLEKGLIMRPQRDVFALGYIDETIEAFGYQVRNYRDGFYVDVNELNWAFDVLVKYFNTVKMNNLLTESKKNFDELNYVPDKSLKEEEEMYPYERDLSKPPSVSYEDFYKLSMRRRSVRWFEQKRVPRELIDKALLVARQTPSACNRLPFEYRIFDDPELVRRVGKIPFGAAGYYENIPTLMVIVGKLDSYFSSRDRHLIYIDASLSAMAFMYAAETLGLSTSGINWPDFELLESKMQKTLGLSVDERPIMLVAVGYPDPTGKVPYSQKKSLEIFRSYNKLTK